MIDALISGKLHKSPVQRMSKTGKPFVTAMIRAPQADSTTLFVSAVAFDSDVCGKLLALSDGDAVAVAGTMTTKTYTDGQGQVHPAADVVVHGILSAYGVKKKRDAFTSPAPKVKQSPAPVPQHWPDTDNEGLSDDIPY